MLKLLLGGRFNPIKRSLWLDRCSRRNLRAIGSLGENLWLESFCRSAGLRHSSALNLEELYMERNTEKLKLARIVLKRPQTP